MSIELKTMECCPECLKSVEELENEQGFMDTIYDCDCGNQFAKSETETHRCEDCGRFATKLTDRGCTECCVEVEELDVWVCQICDEKHNDPVQAYKCCSEPAGEEQPDEVTAELEGRAAQKAARERQAQEKLAKLKQEHPPKYEVGAIIEDIDLSARRNFNRQAFVDAEVTDLKPWGGTMGVQFEWQYVLRRVGAEDSRTSLCDERDIEYQTGRADPSREYRWCCPYTIVSPRGKCKVCEKPFEDISTERRS